MNRSEEPQEDLQMEDQLTVEVKVVCDETDTDDGGDDNTEDDSFSSFDVLQQKIILDAILGSGANAASILTHSPAGKRSSSSSTVAAFATVHAAPARPWKSNPRDRLESWGGLSDVSHPLTHMAPSSSSMAHSSSLQDVEEYMATTMNDESSSSLLRPSKHQQQQQHPKKRHKGITHLETQETMELAAASSIPLKIVLDTNLEKHTRTRERFDSITSFPGFFSRDRLDSIASLGEASINMTLTEQLADLAGTLENVVGGLDTVDSCDSSVSHTPHHLLLHPPPHHRHHRVRFESTAESSMASSSDQGINIKPVEEDLEVVGTVHAAATSLDMTNSAILVDSDAVQAAVEAAMAVTGKLQFLSSHSNFDVMDPSTSSASSTNMNTSRNVKRKHSQKRQLPTWSSSSTTPIHSNRKPNTTSSTKPLIVPPSFIPPMPLIHQSTDAHMEAIRARARAAAGYIHPSMLMVNGGNHTVTPPLPTSNTKVRKSRSQSKYMPPLTSIDTTHSITTSTSNNTSAKTSLSSSLVNERLSTDPNPKGTSLPPLKKRANFMLHPSATHPLDSTLPKQPGLLYSDQGSNIPMDHHHHQQQQQSRKKTSKVNHQVIESCGGETRKRSKKQNLEEMDLNAKKDNHHQEGGGGGGEEEGENFENGKKRKTHDGDKISNQKWDDMYEALLEYKKDVTETETSSLSDSAKTEWIWSGNVPTNYKTKDGKALGRWVNNQRSAKNKGLLRSDRELRLVRSGLKWCVISTNGWADMLNELRIYVGEKTKDGKEWDGNVPTAYKITSNMAPDGSEIDEDKNLGRWINRQRSLYQSGKLKKERQVELENLGLKWVVLSTTSWNTMYDALCIYVEKRKVEGTWDGIIPACYETLDSPPKKLGRWVNRQRTAYLSSRLKDEFYLKLKDLGIKWADESLNKLIQKDEGSISDDAESDAEDAEGDKTSLNAHVHIPENLDDKLDGKKKEGESETDLRKRSNEDLLTNTAPINVDSQIVAV